MAKKKKKKTGSSESPAGAEWGFIPCLAGDDAAILAPEDVPPGFGADAGILPGLEAVMTLDKRWRNGSTITVGYWDQFPQPKVTAKVEEIAAEWTEYANLDFDFVGFDRRADIRISFNLSGGHQSAIGEDSASPFSLSQPSMNLALRADEREEEYRRVILHEFGHALGLQHEHQHPEGGIQWNQSKVYAEFAKPPNNWSQAKTFSNILKRIEHDTRRFRWTKFDPKSIMCYYFPPHLTDGTVQFRQNSDLSENDVALICEMYPGRCSETPPPDKEVKLKVDGKAEKASIGKPGEQDLFVFTVKTADGYIIETEGPTDVTMSLSGPGDKDKIITEDTDAGSGYNARIAEYLEPGTYYVKVWHHKSTETGDYSISVKTWTPSS